MLSKKFCAKGSELCEEYAPINVEGMTRPGGTHLNTLHASPSALKKRPFESLAGETALGLVETGARFRGDAVRLMNLPSKSLTGCLLLLVARRLLGSGSGSNGFGARRCLLVLRRPSSELLEGDEAATGETSYQH